MEKIVKTFRNISQVPSLSAAKVIKHEGTKNQEQVILNSSWSQKCLERGKLVKIRQTHIVNKLTSDVVNLEPSDCSTEIISSVSQSEELRSVVREVPSQENPFKKLQHLEIWQQSFLTSVIDLTALDVHGDVYSDGEFGCFEWSPCEKKILYVAEKKVTKSEPFYKQKAQKSLDKDDSGSGDSKPTKGDEYIYRQDWGEQLEGKHHPAVAIYNLVDEKVIMLEGVPDHLSPGQAIWAPDGGVVGVAWEHEPRRLGLMFCTNRISYIFHLSTDGEFRILSEEGCAVRSPRFSPDGKNLIWLERAAGGTHHGAQRLIKYDWSSNKRDIIVDVVDNKLDVVSPKYFRGLYNLSFPRRCWLTDNIHIVFSTPGPAVDTACVVNIESKQIKLLNNPGETDSLSVLDVFENIILCSRSNLTYPPCLIFSAELPSVLKKTECNLSWLAITRWKCFPGLESVEQSIYYTNATSHVTKDTNEINALYLKPLSNPGQKIPVIVYPHGGPHVNFVNAFTPSSAFFALLGYGVIQTNYRGSSGCGEDYVNFIRAKVGDADVKDVHQLAEELCNNINTNFDPDRKVLFGGSHGGFLVTHLSGQYPDSYKAVSAVNPVTDALAMITVTDIPDWCAVESGYPYSPLGEISKEDFSKMYDASPIRHVSNVKAPTLLLIGKKDLRVPSSQGLQYYFKLKAYKIKTKILVYEDNHSLSQVPVAMDMLINSVLWFNEHLNIMQD